VIVETDLSSGQPRERRQLQPLVLGPDGVPIITDPERAKQDPELSVMAHGHSDVETAVIVALSAASATAELDEDTRVL